MTLEDIRSTCSRLQCVTEDIKWENHLCFSVGSKMFLIASLDSSASFKVAEEEFEELSNRQGFQPAPYLARYKWVFTEDISNLSKKEWETYIDVAYQLVKIKLPKKILKELGFI